MRTKKRNCLAVNFVGVLFLCASGVFADYIEGIDTTDINGYGLDSAFKVLSNGYISGQIIAVYHGALSGYFNYSFDDIKIAAESIRCITVNGSSGPSNQISLCAEYLPYQYQIKNYCFVIKKNKDSTYSKVQILNNLANNRYVYKYGTNTSPNNRVLEKTAYDRSVRYKPNNLNNIYRYGCCGMPGDPLGIKSCSWDPPLPNSNTILGYIFYKAKLGAIIDTTKPINMAQWDSVAFTTSTSCSCWPSGDVYLNMAAVYSEGKSDYLQGWTKSTIEPVNVTPSSTPIEKIQHNLEIKKAPNGFCITFSSLLNYSGSSSLSIYNITGTKVAGFSNVQGNQVFWKTTGQNLAEGQYIVRLELPDGRVLSGRMVYSK
jgi:hypothetical protein